MGLPEDIRRIIESEIESFSENLLDEVNIRLNLENKDEEEENFQDYQYLNMFNDQKAIAVRIYEKNLNPCRYCCPRMQCNGNNGSKRHIKSKNWMELRNTAKCRIRCRPRIPVRSIVEHILLW